ncbi:TetR family transcriptional regulator [Sandaracinobacteroides sp. A072]|uniref:TetR family transcriptional regulator n=1 Tax=Sandaracinobacteroides sp. A072 TaxID=3461146 RepID=UPI0040428361
MADSDPRPARSAERTQRNAERTRAAILAAAQEAFSTKGYAAAGIRDITAMAGVNPALVSRYFGSKEKLYEAALAELLNADVVTGLPRARFGEGVVRLLTAEAGRQRNPLPMMMLASADPTARAITGRLLAALFLEPLARWYGDARGAEKAACFSVIASGLTVYRELYPLPELDTAMSTETRAWLVATFQALID